LRPPRGPVAEQDTQGEIEVALASPRRYSSGKSDPVSVDTELPKMTVTKEAGHEDEAAGIAAGAIQYAERD